MEHKFGYVYIFTNPAMPGQVKIGKTTRRPEERCAELSSATGVPAAFAVFYYRSFEDCHVAEKVIHAVLAEQNLRTAANREFFSMPPASAKELIDKVAASLETPQARATFAGAFLKQAQTLLATPKNTVPQLEEALTLLEHSTSLGEAMAPYLAAETQLGLLERRKSLTADAKDLLVSSARENFELADERGIARGAARSAKLALDQGDKVAYLTLWTRYLDGMPQDEPIPAHEVEYVLAFMHECMHAPEGPCARPEVHPLLIFNASQLQAFASKHEAELPEGFKSWLDSYVVTLQTRLISKAKPLLGVLGLCLVFWFWKPEVFIITVTVILFLAGIAVGLRARFNAHKNKKAEKKAKKLLKWRGG